MVSAQGPGKEQRQGHSLRGAHIIAEQVLRSRGRVFAKLGVFGRRWYRVGGQKVQKGSSMRWAFSALVRCGK